MRCVSSSLCSQCKSIFWSCRWIKNVYEYIKNACVLKPWDASSTPSPWLPQIRMISNCLSLLNGTESLNAGMNELNDHAVSFNVEVSVFFIRRHWTSCICHRHCGTWVVAMLGICLDTVKQQHKLWFPTKTFWLAWEVWSITFQFGCNGNLSFQKPKNNPVSCHVWGVAGEHKWGFPPTPGLFTVWQTMGGCSFWNRLEMLPACLNLIDFHCPLASQSYLGIGPINRY